MNARSLATRHTRWLFLWAVACCQLMLAGCSGESETPPEVVMSPGMTIVATTPAGTLKIIAREGYKRTFEWDGCSKTLRLTPRWHRYQGRKGILFHGNGVTWLFGCGGIYRAVVVEEQMPVESEQEFLEYARLYKGMHFVYRNDGLVVGWIKSGGEMAINVYQVLVRGSKPTELEGADDESIIVSD